MPHPSDQTYPSADLFLQPPESFSVTSTASGESLSGAPLNEEFRQPQGLWEHYDTYDPTLRAIIRDQKHVDIRDFNAIDKAAPLSVLDLSKFPMSELEASAVNSLDDELHVIVPGEDWSLGTNAILSTHNYWRVLEVPLQENASMTSSTTSAIDLETDFEDDDYISLAMPDFPWAHLSGEYTWIQFTSHATADYAAGPTATVRFDQSTTAFVSGNSEFRVLRSALTDSNPAIDLSVITGVRFQFASSQPYNMVGNQSAETDDAGYAAGTNSWWFNSGATMTRPFLFPNTIDGNYAIRFATNGSAIFQGGRYSITPVGGFLAGVTYTAVIHYQTGGGSEPIQCFFGDTSVDAVTSPFQSSGSNTWRKVVLQWTPTANRSFAWLGARTDGVTPVALDLYLDGLMIVKGSFPDLDYIPYSDRNEVADPSFEINTGFWSKYGSGGSTGTMARSQEQARSGTWSMKHTSAGNSTHQEGIVLNRKINVNSGLTYQFSAHIRPNATRNYQMIMYFLASDGVTPTGSATSTSTSCPSGAWTRVTGSMVAPASSEWVVVYIVSSAIPLAGEFFYIDDVMINQGKLLPYFDGSTLRYAWDGVPFASASKSANLVPVSKNLIDNPRAANDLTNFNTGTRVTTDGVTGSTSVVVSNAALPTTSTLQLINGRTTGARMIPANTASVRVRAMVKILSGANVTNLVFGIAVYVHNLDGSTTSGNYQWIAYLPTNTPANEWVPIEATYSPITTGNNAYLRVEIFAYNTSGVNQNVSFRATDFFADINYNKPTQYFDGDSAEYDWSGTAHNSTSVVSPVRLASLRLLSKDWKFGSLDLNTRRGTLVRTVSPNADPIMATEFAQPIVWRSADVPGEADPKPIDFNIAVGFNTGSRVGSNNISIYGRELTEDFLQQLDINGLLQAQLTGRDQPDVGQAMYNTRLQTDLEPFSQDQLYGLKQFDLERTPDYLSASWIQFVVQWSAAATQVSVTNTEGNGYNFSLGTALAANTDYVLVFELRDTAARAAIYPLGARGQIIFSAPVFDSTLIDDDFTYKRRKGRFGWFASLQDGDAYVESIRFRSANYAEYRSLPYESLTPVIGAELAAEASPIIDLFEFFAPTDPSVTVESDRELSVSGESYRVTDYGDFTYQGIHSNEFDITDFDQTEVLLDVYYPSALDPDATLEFYLKNAADYLIPLPKPKLYPDQWQTIRLRTPSAHLAQTGLYRLVVVQSKPVNLNWWVDQVRIFERTVSWHGRAVVEDPWAATEDDWTPFQNAFNRDYGGIMFQGRERKLQIKGVGHKQDAQVAKVQFKPKYAQLGRFVWPEDELTDLDAPTALYSTSNIGRVYTFNGFGSFDPDGQIINWYWTVSDGSVYVGPIIQHTFGQAGTYSVTLTVTDANGLVNTLSNVHSVV